MDLEADGLERRKARDRQDRRRWRARPASTLPPPTPDGLLPCRAPGVAHDLNNLFASIIGGAEQIALANVPAETARVANRILEAAERGAELVKSLLGEARPPEPVDCAEALRLVEELASSLLPSGVLVRGQTRPEGLRCLAQPGELTSALLNLCVNAGHAIAGGGEIVLAARAEGADAVLFEVRDTGCGMTPEVARRAVEPFFTTKPGGAGLGLSRVREFVNRSGGRMEILTRPGSGTSVRLWLPLAEAAPGRPPAAAGGAGQERAAAAPIRVEG